MKHIEFETKYNANDISLERLGELMNSLKYNKQLIFQNICDDYYSRGSTFIRHRYSERYKSNTLTWKEKTNNGNNIIRKEVNLELKHPSAVGIERAREFIEGIGFSLNVRLEKPVVVIYEFDDVLIPYYSIVGENGDISKFLEIEIKEGKIHKFTEYEAWNLIKEWENKLKPLGITYRNRMNKSVWELYRK